MSKARKVYESMMENDFCSQWLRINPILIEEGHCILEMEVRKEMLNGFGTLHGGMAYSLADSALAFASNSYGRISPLINGNMSYAKGAKLGDTLRAEAKVISLGNKKADIDVTITCVGHEEPFYFFRGTVYRTSKEHDV
ncbi:MAG: hotdog fold thioesterase [Bacteroidetes bacterium]|nr:MAG: hotdog fold thioesterase [Bacteroidota bacterium]MBL1145681.1 hotdog fold thioesterase [Bacteroidota bacterium]MCB0803502.1 hotdog fold thioesterase [Flavobacteriales bacterium]NOG58475.1 hotdog fold thioesterase [Bacteroidota bacterium]